MTLFTATEKMNFLLSHEEAKLVHSEIQSKHCWSIFGQQRARGRQNDNPLVGQFMENTQVLMVQKSLAVGGSNSMSQKRGTPDLSPL